MTIVLTGGTGKLGQSVIQALRSSGAQGHFTLAARAPERLASTGMRAVCLDYDDAASVRSALSGASTLVLISSNAENAVRKRQHRDVIREAEAAGVRRIIFTSLLGAADPGDNEVLGVYRDAEQALSESELSALVLRNGVYLDAIPALVAGWEVTGRVALPAGTAPVSWVSRADIASLIVSAALEGALEGVWDVASAPPKGMNEIVDSLAATVGRGIEYVQPTRSEYVQNLIAHGLARGTAETFAEVCRALASGKVVGDPEPLRRRLGRPPLGVDEFMREAFASAHLELG